MASNADGEKNSHHGETNSQCQHDPKGALSLYPHQIIRIKYLQTVYERWHLSGILCACTNDGQRSRVVVQVLTLRIQAIFTCVT